MSRRQAISVVPLLIMAACVEPYNLPSQSERAKGFLVIDGFLDGTKKTGYVRLSRATGLAEYRGTSYEEKATVTVEVEDGGSFSLTEKMNGLYSADNLDLDPLSNYRVRIKTEGGSEYSSDFIQLLQSPSFDSLYWLPQDEGIQFYVNAHDDLEKTHYYHYLFTETWVYRVQFVSHYKRLGSLPVKRGKNELVDTCWQSATNTAILIESTNTLKHDVVNQFPINFIKKGSRNLAIRYSVIVEQRAISESEFQYLTLLRKTNESLGGLFDPIPSAVLGNVHNDDNASEPVLGYFGGGFPAEKRIFITFEDLPKYLQTLDGLGYDCSLSTIKLGGLEELGTSIYVEISDPSIGLYYIASPNCADCRSLGGDTIKPNFWPQ
jgi:hypothetical protein